MSDKQGLTTPSWDLSSLYASAESRHFRSDHESVVAEQARLEALFDRHDVRAGRPLALTDEIVEIFGEVLAALNELLEQIRTTSAYLYARVTGDATDDEAAGLQSRLQAELAPLGVLSKRFEAWVARLDVDRLTDASAVAATHDYPLRRAAEAADHQMSEAEESLSAELRLTGSSAWQRLHRDISARLVASVSYPDGRTASEPMSVVRTLAFDPDAPTRRAAYEAELRAWESVAVPLAAALNGAKGEQAVLDRRRGWPDPLDATLFTNNVDRAALDALTGAVVDALPDFHRYLRTKATHLGHGDGLPWWDLFAPITAGGARSTATWDEAVGHVSDSFASYSPQLAALVDRATREQWIDAEMRAGKATGAFCLPVRPGESRVFLNFDGSANSVQTLAHELGHAYHNTALAERTPLQRRTPMALAETASIFCETIVVSASLAAAGPDQRLTLLDTDLQNATQIVVDIHSRFLFEQELCERRSRGTLSVAALCELMLDAQATAYGDGLDHGYRHPWMWAVKGHYFTPFYNWPYTFGLLFGVGLYARYRDDPDTFRAGYDDLLASTGLGDAASLAARFGIDVRSQAFWAQSLGVLRERIDEFVALA
jgi:pepF/M3 family oligoendopeptidase